MSAHVSDLMLAAGRLAVLWAAEPLGWARGLPSVAASSSRWRRHAWTGVRGTLMALPALLVLSALLMSADPVFARMVEGAFSGGGALAGCAAEIGGLR